MSSAATTSRTGNSSGFIPRDVTENNTGFSQDAHHCLFDTTTRIHNECDTRMIKKKQVSDERYSSSLVPHACRQNISALNLTGRNFRSRLHSWVSCSGGAEANRNVMFLASRTFQYGKVSTLLLPPWFSQGFACLFLPLFLSDRNDQPNAVGKYKGNLFFFLTRHRAAMCVLRKHYCSTEED